MLFVKYHSLSWVAPRAKALYSPRMDQPMTVYIKPGCPWCVEAEDYLRERGYRYERVNVLADRDAFQEMWKLSGQRYVPTMSVGDKILADFGAEELEEFLQEHQIRP